MHEYPGRFFVLEGADASGKTTQFSLLAERFRAVGYDVEIFKFPRYDHDSSHFVKSYLNGDYGPAKDIGPYTASIFYAVDRYEAAPEIRKALQAGKIVLSDRYVGSNMGHQGAKFSDETEQRGFFVWDDSFEFELLGIPRPDLNLYLKVPPETSFKLMKERSQKTGVKLDQHEADKNHLAKAAATYDVLCKLFPKDFVAIDCAENGKLLGIADINNKIWQRLQNILPPPQHRGRATVVKLDKLDPPRTPANQETKSEKKDNQPFGYKTRLSLLTFLKLMGHESLKPRISWPPKFSGEPGSYYLPKGLDRATTAKYQEAMRQIGKLHRKMAAKDPQTAIQAIPLAAYVQVEIPGDINFTQKVINAIDNTQNHQKAQRLAQNGLGGNIAASDEELKLLDFWPRGEFTLLADGLYPYAGLGRQEILDGIDRWSYERKEKALLTVINSTESQVLDELRYRWDGLFSSTEVMEAVRAGSIHDVRLQTPSVRFGYNVPAAAEKHDLEDDFMSCFDMSLELFSALQATDNRDTEPYAALLGHKQRWQFSSGAQILSDTGDSSSSAYAGLLASIREKVSEIHPIIFKALSESKPAVVDTPKHSARRSRHRPRKNRQ